MGVLKTNVLTNITALNLFTLMTSNCMFIFLSVTLIAELPRKPIGKFVRDDGSSLSQLFEVEFLVETIWS